MGGQISYQVSIQQVFTGFLLGYLTDSILQERNERKKGYGNKLGHYKSTVYVSLLYLKRLTNKDLLYSTGNSAQCYVAAWMGGECGGEWIHVYVWLSHFAVHLKLSQHC